MGRSSMDMQRAGTERVRRALLADIAKTLYYHETLHMSPSTHGPSGGVFCVTLDGYDYTITVQFEDPR